MTSKSDFCMRTAVCRLSNPHDDVMSLWTRVQPERCSCSPSRRRTLLPTSSSSTKSVIPASPLDDVWTTRSVSVTDTKNSRGSVLTTSRRHERIVLSREFLVGIVAVEPTRTSIIFKKYKHHSIRQFSCCWQTMRCKCSMSQHLVVKRLAFAKVQLPFSRGKLIDEVTKKKQIVAMTSTGHLWEWLCLIQPLIFWLTFHSNNGHLQSPTVIDDGRLVSVSE